jgi:hypothetical protein
MIGEVRNYRLSLSRGFGRVDGLKDILARDDEDAIGQATEIVKARTASYGAQPHFTAQVYAQVYRPEGAEIAASSIAELAAR